MLYSLIIFATMTAGANGGFVGVWPAEISGFTTEAQCMDAKKRVVDQAVNQTGSINLDARMACVQKGN